jgi:hypothetical protein
MKRHTFLAAPSWPMTCIGFGIVSRPIETRLVGPARFTL